MFRLSNRDELKQEKVIDAMLRCKTLKEVSEETKTPPRTLYTMLKDNDFKTKLNDAKSTMLTQAISKLNYYTSICVDILANIALDETQNGQIRVSACRGLLDMTVKLNEQVDIVARLNVLEERQAENGRDLAGD